MAKSKFVAKQSAAAAQPGSAVYQAEKLDVGARSIGTSQSPYALHYRYGFFSGPDYENLDKYEIAFRRDGIMFRAVHFIALTMVASLGPYSHRNAKMVDFIEEVEQRMEGSWDEALYQLIVSALWSGLGVSEKMFMRVKRQVMLRRLANYHPRSIVIVPDDDGNLVDNQKLTFPYRPLFNRSGIYQQLPANRIVGGKHPNDGRRTVLGQYVRLPLNKIVRVAHNQRHGNHAGESIYAPAWLYYQMVIETFQNLMITTERWGSPQIAAIVPAMPTTERIQDANTGVLRPVTMAEKAVTALSGVNNKSALVFEEPMGMQSYEKVRLQVLSSFNNFGESFWTTIMNLYTLALIAMGVPPLLILEHSEGLGAGAISQVHAAAYKEMLVGLHKEFIVPFEEQVFGQLLRINFDELDAGGFTFRPFDLTALDTLLQIMGPATTSGYLHPDQEEDFHWVRDQMGAPRASDASMASRMATNRQIIKSFAQPDAGKVQVAKVRNDGALATAQENSKTQKHVTRHIVQGQKDVAQLNNDARLAQTKLQTKAAAAKPTPKQA